jgi:hypothetical protein
MRPWAQSQDLLPQTYLGRLYETKALRIRQFAGAGPFARLDPRELAARVGLRLIDIQELMALPSQVREQLLQIDSKSWSGSVTPVLPDGSRLVVLNPTHSETRRSATLMEEICHVLLGHKADRLGITEESKTRDYNSRKESEAYGVGAAALLPFHVLVRCQRSGVGVREIASHYGVSPALVKYRLRIVGLSTENIPEST